MWRLGTGRACSFGRRKAGKDYGVSVLETGVPKEPGQGRNEVTAEWMGIDGIGKDV